MFSLPENFESFLLLSSGIWLSFKTFVMSLKAYKKKRSFTQTPEPEGGKGSGKELRLSFRNTMLHIFIMISDWRWAGY